MYGKITGITGNDNSCVGGFCGRNYGVIDNSYARTSGMITGGKYATGCTTLMNAICSVENCYVKPAQLSYNIVAYDICLYGEGIYTNCYVVTSSTGTSYMKFNQVQDDAELIAAKAATSHGKMLNVGILPVNMQD